jgi:hypothetical protein
MKDFWVQVKASVLQPSKSFKFSGISIQLGPWIQEDKTDKNEEMSCSEELHVLYGGLGVCP